MIKKFHHMCLSVSDIDKSTAFYRDILGLTVLMRAEPCGEEMRAVFDTPPGFNAKSVVFEQGLEISQFVFPAGRESLDLKPWDIGAIFLAFEVTEFDKMYSTLLQKGVNFVSPPITFQLPKPVGNSMRIVHVSGPDGERISLIESVERWY
jgi:catechol 2,3-dioxygenase-like lactoylglutathione lyase family enzyme